ALMSSSDCRGMAWAFSEAEQPESQLNGRLAETIVCVQDWRMWARLLIIIGAAFAVAGSSVPPDSLSMPLAETTSVRVLPTGVQVVTVSRGEILPFEQAATGVLWSGGEYKVASYGATPG